MNETIPIFSLMHIVMAMPLEVVVTLCPKVEGVNMKWRGMKWASLFTTWQCGAAAQGFQK